MKTDTDFKETDNRLPIPSFSYSAETTDTITLRKKSAEDKFSKGVATVSSGVLAKQMGIKQYFQLENTGPIGDPCDSLT